MIYLALLVLLSGCQQQFEQTTPERKNITETVFASGKLAAEGTYNLIARSDGYLIDIRFDEGDVVSDEMVLAVIENEESRINTHGSKELLEIARSNTQQDAPALSQAKASIEIVRQQLELDSLQATRYKKLWKQNSVAKVDYERALLAYHNTQKNLESAIQHYEQLTIEADQHLINSTVNYAVSSESLEHVEVKAIVGGKVYEQHKEVGDYVSRGTVIATIGHPTAIHAEISIDESAIDQVKIGQQAFVQINTRPGETVQAVVSEILPTFNEADQSFTAKLQFTEPLDFQIVGTQLQSNLVVKQIENALVIPRKYLDYNGNVQLYRTGQRVSVKTGTVSNEWVHVLDGIDEDAELTVAVN